MSVIVLGLVAVIVASLVVIAWEAIGSPVDPPWADEEVSS